MLILYQFETSPFCHKIQRILQIKNVPYETRNVGLLESQLGYRKINPTGKVPALSDDGDIICDSTEIAYHLEEHYPTPALLPNDPKERALVQVLEDWADESLYFYQLRLRFGFAHNRAKVLRKLLRPEGKLMQNIGSFLAPQSVLIKLRAQGIGKKSDSLILTEIGRHVDTLKGLLDGKDFLLGSSISLADIAVFVQMVSLQDTPEGEAEIARCQEVLSYLERVDTTTKPTDKKNSSFAA